MTWQRDNNMLVCAQRRRRDGQGKKERVRGEDKRWKVGELRALEEQLLLFGEGCTRKIQQLVSHACFFHAQNHHHVQR